MPLCIIYTQVKRSVSRNAIHHIHGLSITAHGVLYGHTSRTRMQSVTDYRDRPLIQYCAQWAHLQLCTDANSVCSVAQDQLQAFLVDFISVPQTLASDKVSLLLRLSMWAGLSVLSVYHEQACEVWAQLPQQCVYAQNATQLGKLV